jgi:hypothetical protein
MSKHNKGNHGIYSLTCISQKCGRRFKVIYDTTRGRLTYPFTGCPFCGAWWCTGPLDGEAYPKKPKSVRISGPPLTSTERQLLIDALLRDQARARVGISQFKWL